jgi:general L-amino acid transport system permease protein
MAVGGRSRGGLSPGRPALWRDPKVRSLVVQVVVLGAVVLFFAYIAHNTASNLQHRGIASGFGFLQNTAGFDIGFQLIPYTAIATFGRALVVGFLNTLLVSAVGIVLATILGFIVGLMRLSTNWLVSRIAMVYIEVLRNIPLLLQLFFWYTAVLSPLPAARDAIHIGKVVFLSNRGLTTPLPIPGAGFGLVPIALLVGIVASIVVGRWAKARRERTGQTFPVLWVSLGLIIVLPILTFLVIGRPLSFEFPTPGRFRLEGGFTLVPEFMALLLGLVLYTSAFIAEIVRSGIQAVSKGQWEASGALGLAPGQTMRLIVIPQSMRVIVPPLTSEFLSLTKNSSLAVAIGYPDLVAVGGTVLNQSGQAVEVVVIWMVVYVSLSLVTSLFMNWYNKKIALVER